MIQLKDINKIFVTPALTVHACEDVNLTVEAGEVFGIIGTSGAGKSTLVRCINLMERPETGQVRVDGVELTSLSEKELRKERKRIGMIFQLFNLMDSRTVYGNVAYPLKGSGLSKEEERKKILALLDIVGLKDKENAYPSQLSGGQKQRVAIARALANDPKVLLCDECTSALDPQTTASILRLLKELNEKLGLTIVIITHEMAVAKEICDRIAVMDGGRIVETGNTVDIFERPQHGITTEFVNTSNMGNRLLELLADEALFDGLPEGAVLLRLKYGQSSAKSALISEISREFDVDANILFGNIDVVQDVTLGNLVVALSGAKENIPKAVAKLSENDVVVEVIRR